MSGHHTRRAFLRLSGGALGAGWLAAHWPELALAAKAAAAAREEARSFEHLDAAAARDLEAMAARIIPTDETPGSREAGVIWFMDTALGGFMAARRGDLLAELDALNRRVAPGPEPRRFADLPGAEQDRLLAAIEGEPFFETVRFMTLAGFLAMPGYGGNREHAGWSLIGFEHQHGWQPPFGHYDAHYERDGEASDED